VNDVGSRAEVVIKALRAKPDLFFEVLKRSRNASVLSAWKESGGKWIRMDLEGVRVTVKRKGSTWYYRLHGQPKVDGFISAVNARVAADEAARNEGWLLA
jgi:hypothetical protein